MYLVVLAMMPLFMGLHRIGFWAVAAGLGHDLACRPIRRIGLPAEPWSDRQWFFNPFGWQLLFFTGFAFMRGWIPAPPVSKTLIWAAALFLIFSMPFGSWKVFTWINARPPIWPKKSARSGR